MQAIPPTVDVGLGCWLGLKRSSSPVNIKGRYIVYSEYKNIITKGKIQTEQQL